MEGGAPAAGAYPRTLPFFLNGFFGPLLLLFDSPVLSLSLQEVLLRLPRNEFRRKYGARGGCFDGRLPQIVRNLRMSTSNGDGRCALGGGLVELQVEF